MAMFDKFVWLVSFAVSVSMTLNCLHTLPFSDQTENKFNGFNFLSITIWALEKIVFFLCWDTSIKLIERILLQMFI